MRTQAEGEWLSFDVTEAVSEWLNHRGESLFCHHCRTFITQYLPLFYQLILTFASPQTETVDSRSACTAHVARLYHQITTLFPTRVKSWRHDLQVIWLHQLKKCKSAIGILFLSTNPMKNDNVLVHLLIVSKHFYLVYLLQDNWLQTINTSRVHRPYTYRYPPTLTSNVLYSLVKLNDVCCKNNWTAWK